MATNNIGKATSGSPFRPPPAVIWNNMVDAGVAFGDSKFDAGAQPPIRPRSTDIIKIKNDSGGDRSKGQILKIEGKALGTITDESIWLLGIEPTDDCYFGILKEPISDEKLGAIQVSGCCMAKVDISDVDHTRAIALAGEYVLASSDTGPIEILYAPSSTGEQDCVVRFTGATTETAVVLDAALAVASQSKTGASSALARVCEWDALVNDYIETQRQITVWNHSESQGYAVDTFGFARVVQGHYVFAGDCEAMATPSRTALE